jgi:hypothetical protein
MLLHEFTDGQRPTQNVLALLNLIKSQYQSRQAKPKINTLSFLNLAKNVGLTLDYETFADMAQTGSLKNLIKDFNKQYIELTSDDDYSSGDNYSSPDKKKDDADVVGAMAKKAVDI